MGKLRPARCAGVEHAAATQSLECPIADFLGELGHRGRDHWPEADAEHARRLRVAHSFGGDVGEPGAKQGIRRGHSITLGLGQAAAAAHAARDLLEQQRVSRSERGGALDGRPRDRGTGAIVQHLRGGGCTERHEVLDRCITRGGQRREHIERRRWPRAQSSQQGDRQAADPPAEKGQQRQGVLVRPLEVIEQDQAWRGQAVEELLGGVEARCACLQRRLPDGLRVTRTPEAESAQGLVDDAEGKARLGGVSPPDPDAKGAVRSVVGAFDHGGLAQARLRHDEQASPAALLGCGQ